MYLRILRFPIVVYAILFAFVGVSNVAGQQWTVSTDDEWCDDDDWDEKYCEVREITLKADRDVIIVDGDKNGGIRVEGWDRKEILVRAKVSVWNRSRREARELASDIDILTSGRTIRAEGPSQRRRRGWSVSYRLMVPEQSNLSLETTNGGISIASVRGDIRFEATNGGIKLAEVGVDVHGQTTNGGLDIELSGKEWRGEGLDVRTTNGGVTLEVPEDYSAELETGTVNGSIEVDFPITVQGTIGRRLTTELGDGGTRIRALTTNGGVVSRRN